MRNKDDIPFTDIDQKPLPEYYHISSSLDNEAEIITLMVTDSLAPPSWEGSGSVPINPRREAHWMVELGKFLGRQILAANSGSGVQDPHKCILAALPDNYELRRRMRNTGVGGDTYMRGSPHVREFRTPYEFALHARWLIAGAPMREPGKPDCLCRYCGPYNQKAIAEHFWNKTKKASVTNSGAIEAEAISTRGSGRPKRLCTVQGPSYEIHVEEEADNVPASKRRRLTSPRVTQSVQHTLANKEDDSAIIPISEAKSAPGPATALEHAPVEASCIKRRRGRPQKSEHSAPPTSIQNEIGSSTVLDPPPDSALAVTSASTPVKRRGRPPKSKIFDKPAPLGSQSADGFISVISISSLVMTSKRGGRKPRKLRAQDDPHSAESASRVVEALDLALLPDHSLTHVPALPPALAPISDATKHEWVFEEAPRLNTELTSEPVVVSISFLDWLSSNRTAFPPHIQTQRSSSTSSNMGEYSLIDPALQYAHLGH